MSDILKVETSDVSAGGSQNRSSFQGAGQDAYANLKTSYEATKNSLEGEVGDALREEAEKYLASLEAQNEKGSVLGQTTDEAGQLLDDTGKSSIAGLR